MTISGTLPDRLCKSRVAFTEPRGSENLGGVPKRLKEVLCVLGSTKYVA